MVKSQPDFGMPFFDDILEESMRRENSLLRLLFLFLFLFVPGTLLANDLTILDVETPEPNTPAEAAKISVYFDLRQGENNIAITGVNAESCSVSIDSVTPEVLKAEVKDFEQGSLGVGIMVIFPIAKNYAEDSFHIRSTLQTLIQKFNRPYDKLNAIPYDSAGSGLGWSTASDGKLNTQINNLTTTDVLEPNLFSAFTPALSLFDSLNNVALKYVIIISDAEGAIVGDRERAMQLIGTFSEHLKKSGIKPIVVAYSPDGAAAMPNMDLLKRIATNAQGVFFKAETTSMFQQVIQRDVYDYIFKQYIYEATLKMDGDSFLDEGKYNLQLTVKTNNSTDKKAVKISWPQLKKNRTWLWVTLGIFCLAGIGVGVFIAIRRRNDDDEEFVDDAPQEVCCATCGKPIPQQLFGFKGEFCLSGGLPDCPYYQMPDRGKITITKGVMADTTFFIKKDVTTIGSYAENDIYLADKSVSRKHAAIKTDEGKRYEVRDFGSANGLYINNEKVERKFLKDGDLIRFGTVETVFKLK